MKKKRLKLEVPEESSHFYAVACTASLHQLAWLVNSQLSKNFKEMGAIEKGNLSFPLQKHESSLQEESILLITNKQQGGILIREIPTVDYILKFCGIATDEYRKHTISNLKKIEPITAVISVNPAKVKGISKLEGY